MLIWVMRLQFILLMEWRGSCFFGGIVELTLFRLQMDGCLSSLKKSNFFIFGNFFKGPIWVQPPEKNLGFFEKIKFFVYLLLINNFYSTNHKSTVWLITKNPKNAKNFIFYRKKWEKDVFYYSRVFIDNGNFQLSTVHASIKKARIAHAFTSRLGSVTMPDFTSQSGVVLEPSRFTPCLRIGRTIVTTFTYFMLN